MVDRLSNINKQFAPHAGQTYNGGVKDAPKRDNDIVIIGLTRTAMTRAKKGAQAQTGTESMLKPVLEAVCKQAGIQKQMVDEIVIGNVLLSGAGATNTRMAGFLAGFPATTTVHAINRLCSSGLQAAATIANSIQAGEISVGIAGGVETMSTTSMASMQSKANMHPSVFENKEAADCLVPMGVTSENVAARFGITREMQDKLAVESHKKAAHTQKQGWFKSEITPYQTWIKEKDGSMKQVLVDQDDGIRAQTTMESLGKLKPVFVKENGTTTAGNSSQITDGAACVLLTTRKKAHEMGAKILGRYLSFAAAGVPPEIMGIGPAVAIPAALKKAGLEVADIDVFEINEAFASQATYCVEHLKIPKEKVNPRGGAIALGHPLGMTGARMIVTLMAELERTGKKRGLVSMCIGTGMGACGVFERE